MGKAESDALLETKRNCAELCGRYGDRIAFAAQVFNAAFKITIGILTNSLALVADGAYSVTDAIRALIAVFDSKLNAGAGEKDDREEKSNAAALLAVLFTLVAAALTILMLVKGFLLIFRGAAQVPLLPALGPALISILINFVLARFVTCEGNQANSSCSPSNVRGAVVAIVSSSICFCGIFASLFGLPILDPLAAIMIALLIPHFGYSVLSDVTASIIGTQDRAKTESTITDRKKAVAMLSVCSNTVLVVGKIVIGILIGSVSVISEGIHSGVDLIAAVIAFFAVRVSGRPEDEEHPFGHGKIENLSGTIEAVLIFLAAGWIIFEAGEKLLHPRPMGQIGWGIGIMLVSSVANLIVSHYLFKVGNETDSVALQADAWHLRTDVWTSVGVMSGLVVVWIGEALFPRLHLAWIDPVAAIGVAFLIFSAAWHLTVESGRDLLDASLPDAETKWLRAYLRQWVHDKCDCRYLRTRKAGSTRFVEFDLLVEPSLSVEASHKICDKMTKEIIAKFGEFTKVVIHTEPKD